MRRHRRHISLSLSLSTPWFLGKKPSPGAKNGAPDHLLAGSRRALGCGVPRSRGLFERRCHFPHLVVAFEQAPSCAPTRVGVVSAGRRGHHPRPRRPSICPLACFALPAFRAARGKQVKDAGSEVCFAHERPRTPRCAAPRRPELGCPPCRPGRAVKGALALAPSPCAWFPGRRGPDPARGAQSSFNSSRTHRRSSTVQGGEGQAGQGRSERGVLCTRAIEDAEMRRSSVSWGGGW
jgi:hypothetical protein